jgi:hypothetical protein
MHVEELRRMGNVLWALQLAAGKGSSDCGSRSRPAAIDPGWLSWNGRTIGRLARAIREEDRPDLFPILADALVEAGCTDTEIIEHCRRPGEHGQTCWILRALLARNET